MSSRNRILAALFAVLTLAGAPSARAGIVELGQMLRTPVGRYLLIQTEEGAAVAMRLIGREAATEADLRLVIAKLASEGNAGFAAELEARLANIQSRLAVEALELATGNDLAGAIERMANESLQLSTRRNAFLAERIAPASRQSAQALVAAADASAGAQTAAQPAAQAAPTMFGRDLSGLTFGELKAAGIDFRLANLQEIQAMGGQVSSANFSFASLSRARLMGLTANDAVFEGVVADQVNLRDASLRNTVWRHSVLTRAQLAGADFSGADLRDADLSGAVVQGLGFKSADQVDVRFRDALFDARTRLPFSHETALKLGMIYVD